LSNEIHGTIGKDEDEVYVATVPALPGCISDVNSVEETMSNIKELFVDL
jgi:predicted RNase H-like HicB family nuclease